MKLIGLVYVFIGMVYVGIGDSKITQDGLWDDRAQFLCISDALTLLLWFYIYPTADSNFYYDLIVYDFFRYVFKKHACVFVSYHWCSIVEVFYVQGDVPRYVSWDGTGYVFFGA